MQRKLSQHRKRERILQAEEKKKYSRHDIRFQCQHQPCCSFFSCCSFSRRRCSSSALTASNSFAVLSADSTPSCCGEYCFKASANSWKMKKSTMRENGVKCCHSHFFSSLFISIWKGEANADHLVSAASLNGQETWIILRDFFPSYLSSLSVMNQQRSQSALGRHHTNTTVKTCAACGISHLACKVHKLHQRCMLKHLTNDAFLSHMYTATLGPACHEWRPPPSQHMKQHNTDTTTSDKGI